MMRSLWAGVTGLQAHQIAMDVEGNNIANVNTTGFKYSRANFSDLLSQTAKIATAPQGELGGKNAMQIGLGTQISTVTKIFKQGSIETTDKTTDLAIQGDGFFVVSPDGGTTYKYTRNGDFTFDADGNFVDTNGYIAQGWVRDAETNTIDSTSPIANITIPPGLTTPANATSYVALKATLDSGDTVGTHKSAIYSLDSNNGWVDKNNNGFKDSSNDEVHNENDKGLNAFTVDKKLYERGQDFGVLFDANGKSLGMTNGQGAWVSYAKAQTGKIQVKADASDLTNLSMTINGVTIATTAPIATATSTTVADKDSVVATAIAALINLKTSVTGVVATIEGGNNIVLSNDNDKGTTAAAKNIIVDVDPNPAVTSASTGFKDIQVITAYQYTYSSSPTVALHTYSSEQPRTFTTTEDLREAMQKDARLYVDYTGDGIRDKNDGVTISVNSAGQFEVANPKGDAFNADDGDFTDSTLTSYTKTAIELTSDLAKSDISFPDTTEFNDRIYPSSDVTITVSFPLPAGTRTYGPTGADGLYIPTGTILSAVATIPQGSSAGTPTVQDETQMTALFAASDVAIQAGNSLGVGITLPATYLGTLTVGGVAYSANQTIPAGTTILAAEGTVIFPKGSAIVGAGNTTVLVGSATPTQLKLGTNTKGTDDYPLQLQVTGLTNTTTTNTIAVNSSFVSTLGALGGTLTSGASVRTSQSIYAASHASSTDIYDSLGSKHTVRMEFTKTGYTSTGGSEWSVMISVPEPGDINLGNYPKNIVTGTISFNSDGSLATYSPRNLTYTANNGSTQNQNIELKFGTIGQFDGITSFDKDSNTGGISQDGYEGGDLKGLSVDETGTVIGSFTNGRSFALAQVAMATFANNQGLESDGGNCFIQTSNSGDPIVGQASTGGKGSVQASSLEMSNVDLSRSLTQLIVIQRGYQANSKTITTADEMLNTLLQLK